MGPHTNLHTDVRKSVFIINLGKYVTETIRLLRYIIIILA